MNQDSAVVLTSINAPNSVRRSLTEGALRDGAQVLIVGDTKSPSDFHIDGAPFLSIEHQLATGLRFAALCPTRHYAPKNIGYLEAIRAGAR